MTYDSPPNGMSVEDTVDVFSSLPDAILQHILTKLSTKQAVQTSVLSRRWRNLWRGVPDLSLSEEDFLGAENEPAEALSNLAESVLLLRDRSVAVRRLHIRCGNWIQERRVATWVRAAIMGRGLRALELFLPGGFELPAAVLACASLKELSVQVKYWQITLPNPVCLRSLTKLHVSEVDFLDGSNEKKLEDLIASCPALVELFIKGCYFGSLRIRSTSLERLYYHHYDYNEAAVMLSTPNLRFINVVSEGTGNFYPGHLPFLREGSFDLCCDALAIGGSSLIEFLGWISSVKILKLSDFQVTPAAYDDREFIRSLPVFKNLTDLKLCNSEIRDVDWLVRILLLCAPNLEHLTIEEPAVYPELNDPETWFKKVLPPDYILRCVDIQVSQFSSSNALSNRVEVHFAST